MGLLRLGRRNMEEKHYSFIEFIFLVLLFIISSQTVWFGTNIVPFYGTMINLFILLVCLYLLLRGEIFKKGVVFYESSYIVLFAACIMVVLTAIANEDFGVEYILRIVILISAFYYTKLVGWARFTQLFEDVITLFAGYSLLIHLLSLYLPGLTELFPTIINSNGNSFQNAFLSVVPNYYSFRLYGPFREPGVYQIFLNIALIISLCLREKVIVWRIAILITAIILTMSTTGYIALAMIILLFLISDRKKNQSLSNKTNFKTKQHVFIILLIVITFLSLQTSLLSSEGEVFWKLNDTENESTFSRLASVVADLRILSDYPFFGGGLTSVDEEFANYVVSYFHSRTDHNTNTFLITFATYGLFYGILFSNGYWKLCKSIMGPIQRTLLFIIFVVLFSGENITRYIITYILMFYGYNQRFKMLKF